MNEREKFEAWLKDNWQDPDYSGDTYIQLPSGKEVWVYNSFEIHQAWGGWLACAEQKDKEIVGYQSGIEKQKERIDALKLHIADQQNEIAELKYNNGHLEIDFYCLLDELKELRDKITECWYLSYPESKRTPDEDDKAAKQRIFNIYQDLKDTRFNYRVLNKAWCELENQKKLNEIMHYPECWDTAAYPSVLNAVDECFKCSTCKIED